MLLKYIISIITITNNTTVFLYTDKLENTYWWYANNLFKRNYLKTFPVFASFKLYRQTANETKQQKLYRVIHST